MREFFKKHQLPITFFLLAVIAVLVKFAPFLFGQTLVFGDNYCLRVPGQLFSAQWLAQGIIPFWNPYIFSGLNWISDIHQSILYPTSLLFMIFHPAVALNVTIIAHLLIGYIGMYLLARVIRLEPIYAFLAGCMWMLSTQLMGTVHNLSTLQALPWLPMVIWAGMRIGIKRNATVVFALVAFCQLAAGYPQHAMYSVFSAVIFSFFLGRKNTIVWLKEWVITGIATVGVTSLYWLPFLEGFFESTRVEQTAVQAQLGSLHPAMLLKMFAPAMFDNAQLGMKWGPAWSVQPNWSLYFGWLALVVLGARLLRIRHWDEEDWFFGITSAATLLISMGMYLPGYELLQKAIPLLVWGRGPSILMTITAVTMILWIAKSLRTTKFSPTFIKGLMIIGIIAFVGSLSMLFLANTQMQLLWSQMNTLTGNALSSSPFHTLEKDQIIIQSMFMSTLLASFFFVATLLSLYYKKITFVIVFIIFDILLGSQHIFQFSPQNSYDLPRSWPIFDTQQYRVLSRNANAPYADFGAYWEAMVVRPPFSDSFIGEHELQNFTHLQALRDGLTLDWNMVAGVPMVHGYTALLPADYSNYWESDFQPNINLVDYIKPTDPKLKEWSVKYYLVDTWYPTYGEEFPYGELYRDERWVVYELPGLPRFRYPDGGAVAIGDVRENPNQISFRAINDTPNTEMIIADRWDKNWRAEVNGESVTVQNVNGMRKISLPSGYNEVRMWFYPERFYLGLKISLLTAALLVLWYGRITLRLFSRYGNKT